MITPASPPSSRCGSEKMPSPTRSAFNGPLKARMMYQAKVRSSSLIQKGTTSINTSSGRRRRGATCAM